MKTRKIFIASVLFFCVGSISLKLFSQNVDSIILQHTDSKGVVNIDSLLPINRNYFYNNPDMAYEMAHRLIAIAKKQKNRLQLANSYRLLGAFQTDIKSNFDSARIYYELAEDLYRSLDSKEANIGLGAILHNYGSMEQRQGDYVKAIEYYTEALRMLDMSGDMKIRPITLNNLSVMYAFLKDLPKSEKYARESIALSQQSGVEYVNATARLSLIHSLISQDKNEEAIPELEEVLKVSEKENNLQLKTLYHYNYGTYYSNKKEYEKAISEFKKAEETAVLLSNEWEVMRASSALAEYYFLNGQFQEAHQSGEKALDIAIRAKSNDIRERVLLLLSKTFAQKLDYQSAYNNLNAAYLLRDSLYSDNNRQHIAFLEAQYQTEKKEIRISALEKERVLYGIIFGVSLLGIIILLGALYLRQRAKKQLAQQQVIQLEKEKQLIATHAILEGEATERTRLARDLHDGLGGMLSAVKLNLFDMKKGGAVLASEDVSRFNKVVEMLDSSITELRRVAHNMMPDSLSRYGLKVSLQDFCDSFSNVHFHFFGNDERLDNTLEIMIYRSVHELVNNALKYAEAENINVQIVQEDDRVSLTVQDDGKGFDVQQKVKGTGLNNIRTRAESVGGSLEVYSEPGKGTEINVEFKA